MRLGARAFRVTFSPSIKDYLVENGFSRTFGARPLKRLISKEIIQRISANVVKQQIGERIS